MRELDGGGGRLCDAEALSRDAEAVADRLVEGEGLSKGETVGVVVGGTLGLAVPSCVGDTLALCVGVTPCDVDGEAGAVVVWVWVPDTTLAVVDRDCVGERDGVCDCVDERVGDKDCAWVRVRDWVCDAVCVGDCDAVAEFDAVPEFDLEQGGRSPSGGAMYAGAFPRSSLVGGS